MIKKQERKKIVRWILIMCMIMNLTGCKATGSSAVKEVVMSTSNGPVMAPQKVDFSVAILKINEDDNTLSVTGVDETAVKYLGEICIVDCKGADIIDRKGKAFKFSNLKKGQVIQIKAEQIVEGYPSRTETEEITVTSIYKELDEIGLKEKRLEVYGKADDIKIKKKLDDYPKEISGNQGRVFGFTVITNQVVSGGQVYYEFFNKNIKQKKPASMIVLQYTLEGKAVLRYVSYKNGEFYYVEDISRVSNAAKEKYNTNTYKYLKIFNSKNDENVKIKRVMLLNDDKVTIEDIEKFEADNKFNGNEVYQELFAVKASSLSKKK